LTANHSGNFENTTAGRRGGTERCAGKEKLAHRERKARGRKQGEDTGGRKIRGERENNAPLGALACTLRRFAGVRKRRGGATWGRGAKGEEVVGSSELHGSALA